MNFRKVTAIFSSLDLDKVENALTGIGVPGMTVSKTHGFGEYRNYYTRDTMTDCVRVEIFTEADQADQADEVVRAIARTVHKGLESEGIIAVLPVEELVYIHDFKES